MDKYRKLIAAVIVPGIMWAAEAMGAPIPEGFDVQLTAVLTAFFVWLIPNA